MEHLQQCFTAQERNLTMSEKSKNTSAAEQQAPADAVYAELPEPTASIGIDDAWHEPAMRDFADRTNALRMQAAPKTAPGELSADSLRHQNKLLAETLGACILASGIVRKDIDGFTGPELLHFGEDLRSMLEVAPQQEAQEPVMIYHGRCTIDCGEHGHHDVEMLRMIPAGSKLYTAR